MDSTKLSIAVITFSIITGLMVSTVVTGDLDIPSFTAELSSNPRTQNDTGNLTSSKESGLVYGSAHEHALFHVVINNTQKDFTGKKFQLNSKYVHLENNRSQIVHKHAENVTWKHFLDTINTTVNASNSSQVCISIYGNRTCGNGQAVLNGENVTSLDAEIEQGDNLLIILGKNLGSKIQAYMALELPEAYRPEKPGYSV